jgi:hypothetical protein
MRFAIAALALAASGMAAAGVLGVATAETPGSPAAPVRTVGVEGVASVPLASEASAATATSVYRQAMAEAITDGHAKAQFLAEKGGATLGPVQSLAEGGGYIQCAPGLEYTGGQPDFGSAGGNVVFGGAATPVAAAGRPGAPTPAVGRAKGKRHVKRTHRRHKAKKAVAGTCTLSTQVAVVYQLA